MMSVRFTAFAIVAACLAGCTLETEGSATADPDLLRFSATVLSEDQQAMALAAPSGAEADALQDAGADLLSALFAPSEETQAVTQNGHRYGTPVAYGKIEAVCDAPRRPGTKVASAGGFTVYDSDPRSTALRAHYITGFDDGCARQFSAAIVLTGDVGTHEVVRYMDGNKAGFNGTDSAYEAVKAGFCRVAHGKPCGSRLDALARKTIFLTAYESFGSGATWVEILLHDGDVAAIDFKRN